MGLFRRNLPRAAGTRIAKGFIGPMKYLFGDSTPFPMEENFLDTACAASEAAVALLRADEIRVEERRLVAEADERAQEELAHFDAFARRAVESYAQPTDELRAHMGRAARSMLGEMREEISKWRAAAIATALETAALTQVMPTVGRFFEKHQLPGTEWSLAWGSRLDGTGSAVAQVHGQAPGGLDVSLDVAIPPSHPWAKPQRVSVVEQGVAIHLIKKRVLRKPRVEVESLDALFITEVIDLPGEWTMTLRRSQKKQSPGLRIVISSEGAQEIHVSRIAEDGSRVSEPEIMGPEDTGVLRRLFARVGATLRSLVPHRSRLRAAYFRDLSASELEQPAAIGELMIQSIAPYVREIGRRSNGRDELALKRTLGDGRREELFVSYATVLSGTETLDPEHRELFDAFGLGVREGATTRVMLPASVRPAPPMLTAGTPNSGLMSPGMPNQLNLNPPVLNAPLQAAAQFSAARMPSQGPPSSPPAQLPPAKLPPARMPPRMPAPRAPMNSDAFETQERPIVRIANA